MFVTRKSAFTGKEHTLSLDVTQLQIDLYDSGQYKIQDVFPELSADDREFIKTGVTLQEWSDTFGHSP